MIDSNFHTHSCFSDGKEDLEAYCQKAIELGFHSLGFSDHAPVKFDNSFSIHPAKLNAYFDEIMHLKKVYANKLNVFLGLEADYIPGYTFDFDEFRKQANMDYIIGSIHLVFNRKNGKVWFIDGGNRDVWDEGLEGIFAGDIKAGVRSFFEQNIEMIETQKPEILGHMDKIKMHNKERLFSIEDKWYRDLIDACLDSAKKHNVVVEINTRGLYKGRCEELFPSAHIAAKAHKMDIPLMLNSDAHHPDHLNGAYDMAIKKLKDAGIKSLVEFSACGWKSVPLV
jgi:histidinol-phosphatase (PHP family)